jgi:hypothetical protein
MVGIRLFPVPPDEDGLAGVDISEERGRLAPQPSPEGDGDGEPPGGQVAGPATNTAQAPTGCTTYNFDYDQKLALQRTNAENSKQMFPEKELRGHSPNSNILSDFYIPTIDLPILLQENMCGPILGIYESQTHECGNRY